MLVTERLLLRECSINDIDDFHEIMHKSDCIIGGWKPSPNKHDSFELLKSYVECGDRMEVVLRDSNKLIGLIRIYDDNNRGKYKAKMINYLLNSDYWGKAI